MAARILVIDDSPISRELLQAGLTDAGWSPTVVADVAGLCAALDAGTFDGCVVDLEMPEAFGDDVVEFLRNKRGVDKPIVLYSDYDPVELARRAKAARADAWVNKSEGIGKLLAVMKSLIERTGEKVPEPPAAAQVAAAKPAEKAPDALADAAKPAGDKPVEKRRVMIVDDSEMTAKLIEAELGARNFQVVLADSVDKATRLILKKQTRPELILLDVNMPNVDGASFCRFIKGNSLFKGIKVVLCSGMDHEKLKAVAAECGADGFVAKDAFLSKFVLEKIAEVEQVIRPKP
ncbi:MAG TPA: response regulator [Myxococcales bacterium]